MTKYIALPRGGWMDSLGSEAENTKSSIFFKEEIPLDGKKILRRKILPRPILLRVRWTAGGALWFSVRVARQRPSPSWRESKTFTVDGSTGYRRPTRPPNSQYARVHHSLCPVSPVDRRWEKRRVNITSFSSSSMNVRMTLLWSLS